MWPWVVPSRVRLVDHRFRYYTASALIAPDSFSVCKKA
jgi:hypothetical protein